MVLFLCYLKPKISVKFFDIIFHLLVKGFCCIAINRSQICVKHYPNTSNDIYDAA